MVKPAHANTNDTDGHADKKLENTEDKYAATTGNLLLVSLHYYTCSWRCNINVLHVRNIFRAITMNSNTRLGSSNALHT